MVSKTATAIAPSNIAFIKYWGLKDQRLTLPTNGSLSMCLDRCTTETTVSFEEGREDDEIWLALHSATDEFRLATDRSRERVVAQLDRLRALAGTTLRAYVRSYNTFPAEAGIASSASAFAALTYATASALGLDLSESELSRLTRLSGSGSACRSIPTGFVEWDGFSDADSFAHSIAAPDHWPLADLVAVVTKGSKRVASESGHLLAWTSTYFAPRLAELPQRIREVRESLLQRDFSRFAEAVEADAVSLHVVGMTSKPPIFYWDAPTMLIIKEVQDWRAAGLPCAFTIDAGPNVHVICEQQYAIPLRNKLLSLPGVLEVIENNVGIGTRLKG